MLWLQERTADLGGHGRTRRPGWDQLKEALRADRAPDPAQLDELARLLDFLRQPRWSPQEVRAQRLQALTWLVRGHKAQRLWLEELQQGLEHDVLAQRARRGDRRAFDRLCELLYKRLLPRLMVEPDQDWLLESFGMALMKFRAALVQEKVQLHFLQYPDPVSASVRRFAQLGALSEKRREDKHQQRAVSVASFHEEASAQEVLDHVSAQEADHLHREQGQEARLEERQRSDALRGVIDALLARHPKRRLGLRALLLHSQEQTYQEIARELGCKSSYARQLRWRGELWLQEFLLMHPDEHHTLAEEGQSYLSHALYILLKVLRKKLRGSSEGRLRLLVQGLDLDAGLRGAVFALLRDWQALERAFSRASAEQWRALWLGQQALSGATRSLVHFLFGQLPSRAGQRRAFASPGQVQGLDWGAELLEQGRCALRKLHEALRAPGRLLRPRAARSPGLLRRAQMTLLTCLPALPLARLAMSTVKPKARGEPRALRWSLVRRQRPRPGPAAPHQRSAPTDRRAPPQDTLWPPTGPPWLTWAQALGDEPPGSAPTRVIAPLDGHGCVQRRALSS